MTHYKNRTGKDNESYHRYFQSNLNVYHPKREQTKRFEKSRGLHALGLWLSRLAAFEATGPYHGALESAFAGRIPLVQINPLQVRRFAQACATRPHTVRPIQVVTGPDGHRV